MYGESIIFIKYKTGISPAIHLNVSLIEHSLENIDKIHFSLNATFTSPIGAQHSERSMVVAKQNMA